MKRWKNLLALQNEPEASLLNGNSTYADLGTTYYSAPVQTAPSPKVIFPVASEPTLLKQAETIFQKYQELAANVGVAPETSGVVAQNGLTYVEDAPILVLNDTETPVVTYVDPAVNSSDTKVTETSLANQLLESIITPDEKTKAAASSSDKTLMYILFGGAAAGLLILLLKK